MNHIKTILSVTMLLILLVCSIPTHRINAAQNPGNTTSHYTSSYAQNEMNYFLSMANMIQAMQADGNVVNSVLNDLASRLTLFPIITITDFIELLEVEAVIDYVDSILDTVTITIENSDGYTKAKSAVKAIKVIINSTKNTLSNVTDATTNAITPVPSVAPVPKVPFASSNNLVPSVTPSPAVTPKTSKTQSQTKEKNAQKNYREKLLTVEDVKSWNWKEGGTIQVGGWYCSFGFSKATGLIFIQNERIQNHRTSDADIIVAKDQWVNLPEFKYGKYKYKTNYNIWHQYLKRTSNMTLKSTDPNRPLPIAGDIFIDAKGKKTKLTAIKYDREVVVGYGQKLDLYSGMRCEDGILKPDGFCTSWYGDKKYINDYYTIASNGEGHFTRDWITIASYEDSLTEKVKKPKAGQICGYWTKYNAKKKTWEWIGPDY